jgi:hypothetical protein
MQEFRADGNHAMCKIQNSTIPVVHLIQFQGQSMKTFQGIGVLNHLQKCQVLQYKMAAQAMEVPG